MRKVYAIPIAAVVLAAALVWLSCSRQGPVAPLAPKKPVQGLAQVVISPGDGEITPGQEEEHLIIENPLDALRAQYSTSLGTIDVRTADLSISKDTRSTAAAVPAFTEVTFAYILSVEAAKTVTDCTVRDPIPAELDIIEDSAVGFEGATVKLEQDSKGRIRRWRVTKDRLEAGERLEGAILVRTNKNPSGRQRYTDEGTFTVNGGYAYEYRNGEKVSGESPAGVVATVQAVIAH